MYLTSLFESPFKMKLLFTSPFFEYTLHNGVESILKERTVKVGINFKGYLKIRRRIMIVISRACQMKMTHCLNFFTSDALKTAAAADTLRVADAPLAQGAPNKMHTGSALAIKAASPKFREGAGYWA